MVDERQDGSGPETRHGGVDRRRRRLTGAAAAAVPAFFILRHRSARAEWACQSMSGWNVNASMRPSAQHSQIVSCSGRSPGYWKNHPDAWSGYSPGTVKQEYAVASTNVTVEYEGGTRFFDVFAYAPHFLVENDAELTLMDVLHLSGNDDPQKMGAYVVAALLNAAAGKTEPVSVTRVQEVWRSWVTTNTYSPPPGVDVWYAADIKRYFETTWS